MDYLIAALVALCWIIAGVMVARIVGNKLD